MSRLVRLQIKPDPDSEVTPRAMMQIMESIVAFEKRFKLEFVIKKLAAGLGFFVVCDYRLVALVRAQFESRYPGAEVLEFDDEWPLNTRSRYFVFKASKHNCLRELEVQEERLRQVVVDPAVSLWSVLERMEVGTTLSFSVRRLFWWSRWLATEGKVLGVKIKLNYCRKADLRNVIAVLGQFGLEVKSTYWSCGGNYLAAQEMAMLYHLPMLADQAQGIMWSSGASLPLSKRLKSVDSWDVPLGASSWRGEQVDLGLLTDDRRRHCYLLGKTGMGKSTLLKRMIVEDMQKGQGVAVLDPHGDLVESLLRLVPKSRINDVVYFDPGDSDFPVGLDFLADSAMPALMASGILSVFKRLYQHSWGPRLEYILRNALLSVLALPDADLFTLMRLLQDVAYRERVLPGIDDPVLTNFWQREFANMHDRQRAEALAPIQNKLGQFLTNPVVRNVLGQKTKPLDLRTVMDEKKIFLANLSRGRLGDDVSALLGAVLVTKFQLAAMSRVDLQEAERTDFYLYVDEFQNFATDSFTTILAEARKYRLNLILANQYLGQLEEPIQKAVWGNVGSLLAFQVGVEDAELLKVQFGESVKLALLQNMPKYNVLARLLVEGEVQDPIVLATEPVACAPSIRIAEKVRRVSRQRYGYAAAKLEARIKRRLGH